MSTDPPSPAPSPSSPPPDAGEQPGEYPFTRGIHREMYRSRLWTFRQYSGFGTARETNARFRYLLGAGQTGLSVAFDLPTQIGYDSDDAIALGEVGKVGVPISRLSDLDELFEDIPLDKVSISMTINSTAAILLAFLVALARRRDIDPSTLRGTLQNDILKEFIARRTWRFPPEPSLRLVTDVCAYCRDELPAFNPISISGYHLREAGADATEEVGLTLANAIAYFEAARDAGVDAEYLGARASFFWNAHNDLFEEIAKFRAARRVWATIVRDRFGVRSERSQKMRFHTQTAGSTLTFQEPENNVVRVAYQALAAVLGGTQSLHTNGLDEAIGLPSEHAARLALRTQQILAHETGVPREPDPLGGCPFVEGLTDELEKSIRELIEEVDRRGGARRAIEAGFPQALIRERAYRHQRAVESGEQIVVGVQGDTEEADESPPPSAQRVDPVLETERIERLTSWRPRRDTHSVEKLRANLRGAAAGDANLLPCLIECAEGDVTLGEMARTMAEVFGEHVE